MIEIVIPYRNRKNNLEKILPLLRAKMEQSNNPYWISIIEQDDQDLFNVGKLLNVGFKICYSEQIQYNGSFIFHPVDCYPVLSCNIPYKITHRGVIAMMSKDYNYPKGFIFNAMDFYFMNGYSNDYWGWGGEDWEPERKAATYELPYVKTFYEFDRSEDLSGANDETNIPNMNKCFSRSIKDWNRNGLYQTEYTITESRSYGENTTLFKVKI